VRAGKGYRCVANFESEAREVRSETLNAIKISLEAAGVVFVEENGDVGVRMRKGR